MPTESGPPSIADRGDRRLALYVRSLAPAGARAPLATVIDRLDRLEATDRIATSTVHVWGKAVCPELAARTEAGETMLHHIATFEAWAREHDRRLASGFDTRNVDSTITDEAYTVITLPVLTLAEYHDETLVHVAPCTDGDTVTTVTDRLARVETTGVAPDAAAPGHTSGAQGVLDEEVDTDA